jgi:hypothetical protein
MLCNLKFGTFFLFAGFVLLMTLFVIFCVPETRGVPIEELNEVIMQKVRGRGGFCSFGFERGPPTTNAAAARLPRRAPSNAQGALPRAASPGPHRLTPHALSLLPAALAVEPRRQERAGAAGPGDGQGGGEERQRVRGAAPEAALSRAASHRRVAPAQGCCHAARHASRGRGRAAAVSANDQHPSFDPPRAHPARGPCAAAVVSPPRSVSAPPVAAPAMCAGRGRASAWVPFFRHEGRPARPWARQANLLAPGPRQRRAP